MNIKMLKDEGKVDRYKKVIREIKSRFNLDAQKDVAAHFGYSEKPYIEIVDTLKASEMEKFNY